MTWNHTAVDRLRHCHPTPPSQGAVGQPPSSYLGILTKEFQHTPQRCDGSPTQPLTSSHPYATAKCTRAQVRAICIDPAVDVLEAYAAVMAWGGQHRRWFRASLHHAAALRELLCYLRTSTANRSDDFGITQRAAGPVTGLGISYYTKLLYFFRPAPDAYILDQWTAKSVRVLTGNVVRLSPWGGPATDTTPQEYEEFCLTLEALGQLLGGWSGEQVEQGIFDKPGGCWRSWVSEQFDGLDEDPVEDTDSTQDETDADSDAGGTNPPGSPAGPSSGSSGPGSMNWLSKVIVAEHISGLAAQLPLPPAPPRPPTEKRILISGTGVSQVVWFYNLRENEIEIGVYFAPPARQQLQSLVQANQGSGWFGAAAASPTSGKISATIPWGRTAPVTEWANIAETAVSMMSCIWSLVHHVATSGGISHPQL